MFRSEISHYIIDGNPLNLQFVHWFLLDILVKTAKLMFEHTTETMLLTDFFTLCQYRSFFQSLCVLGYCILPLTVAMIVCRIVLLGGSGLVNFVVRLIVVTASFSWSTFGKNQSIFCICF